VPRVALDVRRPPALRAQCVHHGVDDRDQLALVVTREEQEEVREVGHRADFLTTDHTLRHFREEIRHTRLPTRGKRDRWEREGATTLEERAAGRVREVLGRTHESHLTSEQERALRALEERFLAALAAA